MGVVEQNQRLRLHYVSGSTSSALFQCPEQIATCHTPSTWKYIIFNLIYACGERGPQEYFTSGHRVYACDAMINWNGPASDLGDRPIVYRFLMARCRV
jgi:hypothetical protein